MNPNFGNKDPVGRQELRKRWRDRPKRCQAVLSTVERPTRVVIGNLSGQQAEVPARDVRRIGDDDIKASPHRNRPIADQEDCPFGKTELRGVVGRRLHSGFDNIDPDAPRRPKLTEEREQKTTCTRAEIQQAKRRISIRLPPEHRLYNGFRLGPGIERLGGQSKFETPELASSKNAAERLVLDHPRHHLLDAEALLLVDDMIWVSKQTS